MKRVCLGLPGRPCTNLTTRSRCTGCQAVRDRERDAERGSPAERGYDSAWRRLSAVQIARQPWCTDCGHTGSRYNPLTADHIIPKALGGRDELANLTTRCRRHNSAKRDRL